MLDFYGIDSTQYGVCHSDELYMFWNPYGLESYNLNEVRKTSINIKHDMFERFFNNYLDTLQNDKTMSDKMTHAWVDFACTGRII